MPEDSSRKRRTPAEIAQAELEKAEQRIDKAVKRLEKAREEYKAATAELDRAKRFRDYAASNPDLPETDAGDVVGQLTQNDGIDPDEG